MQEMPRNEYWRAIELLSGVSINHLFARAVLEHRCLGDVFVDRVERPGVVYVVHPYGMSLVFGREGAPLDDELLFQVVSRPRAACEWLQVVPPEWGERLTRLASSVTIDVERHTRVNFAFEPRRFHALRASRPTSTHAIVRVDRDLFERTRGSVVPRLFWNDAEDFLEHGLGFALMLDGDPAAMAFSSFVIGSELELGIETADQHRGRGLALEVCTMLVDACIARGLTPVWACRLGNTASYRLAEKLGFEVSRHLPYFRLPERAGTQPSERRSHASEFRDGRLPRPRGKVDIAQTPSDALTGPSVAMMADLSAGGPERGAASRMPPCSRIPRF